MAGLQKCHVSSTLNASQTGSTVLPSCDIQPSSKWLLKKIISLCSRNKTDLLGTGTALPATAAPNLCGWDPAEGNRLKKKKKEEKVK